MPAPKPSFRPRPGGGFNPGMGQFGEHMDDDAAQQAVGQKALGQQSVSTAQQKPATPPPVQQTPPREVGSIADEAKRAASDVWSEIKQFFSLHTWLGINPDTLTQEEKQQASQFHQNWNKLTQAEQEVAQKKYQESMQKKKQEEEEQLRQEEEKRRSEAQPIQAPSGPKKGPVGPGGSKKQKATQQLQQDRKTLGGPKGSN
jgi:hypothetical protein